MLLTILLLLLMMAGLFLLLYSSVALIQDKKFFTSAPKVVQETVQPKPERFPGAHILGYTLLITAFIMMGFAVIFGAYEGIQRSFTFGAFLLRFLVLLLGLELYDILIFDWYLLCRSGFFSHYFPEVKPLLGPHLFGFNWKTHLITAILIVVVSFILSYVCTLF